MISERQLAQKHSSFWRDIAPMGETFWRAQHAHILQKWEPIKTNAYRFSRAFINELAFVAFTNIVKAGENNNVLKAYVENGIETATAYISRFQNNLNTYQLTENDILEAMTLAGRLYDYFSSVGVMNDTILRPKFVGCGEIMAAEGDLIVGQTLYEIKAGNRPFRISDLRQVLTYCALNRLQPISTINEIALLNPRVGLLWTYNLDMCCLSIAGKSASELFDDIVDYVCQPRNYL